MKTTFIYGLWDPRYYKLRYIGKSDNPKERLWGHVLSAKHGENSHKAKWIRGLLKEGLTPSIEILEEVLIDKWVEAEREWIKECRNYGLSLTNISDGGDGGIGGTPSEETRYRLKISHLGRKHSEEQKRKISEKNRGRIMSPESRRKIGDGNRGKVKSPELIEKMRITRIGKKHSDETRRKMSESHKGKGHSDDTKEKLRILHLGVGHSEQTKKRLSEISKGKVLSEDTKKKISEGGKKAWVKRKESGYSISDETRKKMSISARLEMSEERKKKLKGNKNRLGKKHSEETRQKMRETWARKRLAKSEN